MRSIVVILHNVRSLHNVGSIFRTSDGAGVENIYLCGITPLPLDRLGRVRPQIAKVALGAERSLPWEHRPRTSSLIKELRARGYRVIAVEQNHNAVPLREGIRSVPKHAPIALVFGNEVRGIPSPIIANADLVCSIPMFGGKESLNVSVAVGIALFGFRQSEEK